MRALSLLVPGLLLSGCVGGDGASDDTAGMSDTADSAGRDHGSGTITGTVQVQLYTYDDDGELIELSWADAGDTFPFGGIFVAAYSHDDTTNETTYYDSTTILAPSTTGDTYELNVDLDDAETVQVYAALDWWPDGVIGTSEPIGIYPDEISLVEGGAVNDVDITIQSPQLPTGGGGGGTYITISGGVEITNAYTGGDGKVMLYDSFGAGPSYVTSFTPTATAEGAEAEYSLVSYAGYGEGRVLGAWDSNVNGLIEPTDTWGAYVVSDESGNPVTVGTSDMTGIDVRIPFGTPPALMPFVRLEGSIGYADDFSTLPAGTVVYVTALRTVPGGDFTVADLERGYDWSSFTGADLTGTSLDYVLVAPSSAVAYLWAYADTDGDGILNEAGEPVASFGRTGRISTGTESQDSLDMPLQAVVE